MGPTRSVSFYETLLVYLAETSNTTLSLLLYCALSSQRASAGKRCLWWAFRDPSVGTGSAWLKSKYSSMTLENSWNWPLAYRDRSRVTNLLTAWDLDSPSS